MMRSPGRLRRVCGLLLILIAIAAIELFAGLGWRLPTAALVLLPLVVLTTLVGGLGAGMLGALVSSGYYFYRYHEPGIGWLEDVSLHVWSSTVATLVVVPLTEIVRRRLVAERRLIESALDQTLAAADDAFITLDHDWRLVYLNQQAEQLWGRKRGQLLGRSLWSAVPELCGTDLERQLREAATRVQPVRFESDQCARGRWMAVSAWPSPHGLSVYLHDVTERKVDEAGQQFRLDMNEQLRVLEEPAEIIAAASRALGEHLRVSRVVYMEVDVEAREFVVVHEYLAEGVAALQRRWRADEMAPRTVDHLSAGRTLRVNDATTDDLEPVVREILASMDVRAVITVPLMREGMFAASLSVHDHEPRMWADYEVNVVEEVAGWTRQALERARAEHALRESQQWLRFVLQATRVGTWDWEISSGHVYWSDNLEAVHGLETGAFGGTFESYFDHVHPEDAEKVRWALDRALEYDEPYYAEYRFIGSDGAVRWIEARGLVVHDESGQAVRLSGICTEVTDRKRTEERLQHLNETLEQRVQERTQEIRTLAHQLSEAEQRERARLAHVLHDHLQQLLLAGKMKIGMLRTKAPQELRPEMQASEELLGQAIDASRSLAVELSPPILQHRGLVAALQWLAAQQRQYGLTIEVRIQADLPEQGLSEVARTFVFQAVRELLLNVAKHAAVDRATLGVTAVDGVIAIVVEDEGSGCDPAEALDPRETEGTGLGIASIKYRLELLGGSFEMHSRTGQGCRVVLRVPIEPP